MNDKNERILFLRHQISKLEPEILSYEILAKNNPDNFALQFEAQMNQRALSRRQTEFNQLVHEAHKEIIEIRLTGDQIGIGIAPVRSIADFLETFQKLFERISQSLVYGPRDCGQIPSNIKDISSLQIEAIAAGSFKMLLSGNIPKCGIFDQDSNVLSDNVFSKTTDTFFDILEVKTPDEILEQITPLGHCAIKSFKDFIDTIAEHHLNITSSWDAISGERRKFECDHDFINSLALSLDQILDPVYDIVEYTGRFINIHSEKKRFEFRISETETIKGNFPEEVKSALRELGVNPLAEKTYTAKFSKEVYKMKVEGTTKTIWTLLSIK